MLPVPNRLRRPDEFAAVVRRGRRAGRQTLVVHVMGTGANSPAGRTGATAAPRAGFVVSKAVGDAVTRNRVKRRLRHLVGDRLPTVPPGTALVVRALPDAASATFAELGDDLDRALSRALRAQPRATGRRSEGS